jgi:two-component system phosphate regulon sensor histidine kinase PhoR
MSSLRIFLALLLLLAILATAIFGLAAYRLTTAAGSGAPPDARSLFFAACALFALLLAPQAAVYLWASHHVSDLESMTRRVREALADPRRPIDVAAFGGEAGDLARTVEEMRRMLVAQIVRFDEQKAVVSEIIDGLREGMLAIDRRRMVVLANRRILDLFSLQGAVVGRSIAEVLRSAVLLAAFDEALKGEESTRRATIDLAGEGRTIEIRTFPLSASGDMAAVALFIDVTRIEHLETVRRDFLDDFSHEVRTPLAGLRSAVETFEHGPLTTDQEARLRSVIQRQLGRLERLVLQISELNRIEAGEVIPRSETIELKRLLSDVAEEFRTRSAAEATVNGEEVEISGDPIHLQQVFSNLIDNAIKHSGRPAHVEITVAAADGMAEVRVRDFGEGIVPSEQEKIFRRFYRVDRSRSQEVPGTGLGLAIVKHLVLAHGGTVGVESLPNQGATLIVRLPLASDPSRS